eukprot:scaffold242833_cov34-Tisochrysis_lutea.AAC.3
MIAWSPSMSSGDQHHSGEEHHDTGLEYRHELKVLVLLDVDRYACGIRKEPWEPEANENFSAYGDDIHPKEGCGHVEERAKSRNHGRDDQ